MYLLNWEKSLDSPYLWNELGYVSHNSKKTLRFSVLKVKQYVWTFQFEVFENYFLRAIKISLLMNKNQNEVPESI